MNYDIIIVGAGASGITAAITAKDMGCNVAILEGSDRIGKKILTTGNGRCNITNENIIPLRYHSNNPNFFVDVLNEFTYKDTINFFYSLGLPLVTLDEGKMYPMSLQASSVLDVLRLALSEKDIPLHLNTKVKDVKSNKNGFKLYCSNGEIFQCKKLIIATGGKSAANTGSDGSGFNISKSLGHHIINPVPALVQLKLQYNHLKALSGVKFDGFAEIFVNGKPMRKEFGEILFTDYGISGPPILQLSRTASYNLDKKNEVILKVDLMPNFSKESLIEFLENHWGTFSYRTVQESFIGVINKKVIPILLKEAGVTNIHKPCWDLDWKEKNNIFTLLKEWAFTVIDTNGFKNAQVTAGGIDTTEVNHSTLGSKLIPNLYFCGEVLDVDGDCGGFNLQWAWSSGIAAAKSAGK
ncbi:NAD(P)/FAD-dependent oxidoreductase [Haloimpatiens lingqiaonensis]|uniref:NAD(P)/FAD-dependent oxidoreductase n=1 Tax=Haloimpatiens lingqiaonensis TaxID=1380675 RepID=UPI0010FF49C8|nr:NAD(P)/FAD-dependent oxidoreductase [Haloimpatiens lingqiaonensis]